jgi:hypothetical protein
MAEFEESIGDAAEWSALRMRTGNWLHCRDSRLNPGPVLPADFTGAEEEGENVVIERAFSGAARRVGELIVARRKLLRQEKPTVDMDLRVGKGKMLVCFPSSVAGDGLSMAVTESFFDQLDIPPWDLWVHYGYSTKGGDDMLIAYVPEEYTKVASDGIMVNSVQAIMWLRDGAGTLEEVRRMKRIVRRTRKHLL